MSNNFSKCPSGVSLHTLSKLLNLSSLIVKPLTPLIWESVLFYLLSPKDGCYPTSGDFEWTWYGAYNWNKQFQSNPYNGEVSEGLKENLVRTPLKTVDKNTFYHLWFAELESECGGTGFLKTDPRLNYLRNLSGLNWAIMHCTPTYSSE